MSYDAGWCAKRKRIRRNVAGHHGTRANYATTPDSYAFQDRGADAYPNVIFDLDGGSFTGLISIQDVVVVAIHDHHVIADKAVLADPHVAMSRERNAVIYEGPGADLQQGVAPGDHLDGQQAGFQASSFTNLDAPAVLLNPDPASQTHTEGYNVAASQLLLRSQDLERNFR
jgi:hypothetical protein